jgi:hypothetical protein
MALAGGQFASAAVDVGLTTLALLGSVLAAWALIVAVRWTPHRANEVHRDGGHLQPIRFWRPSQYSRALLCLTENCDQLQRGQFYSGPQRGRVTESDLVRWIVQHVLTCAAQIVPQSLGKANLFRVSSLGQDEHGVTNAINLYSYEFVGAFSRDQLIADFDPTVLRRLHVDESSRDYPAALSCVRAHQPIVQSLSPRRLDHPERQLGTTHILAIPLVLDGVHGVTRQDQVVSITVDLRYGRLGGWLFDRRPFETTTLYSRALRLMRLLTEVRQLYDPRFLIGAAPMVEPLPASVVNDRTTLRMGFSVDISGYSSRSAPDQEDAQRRVTDLVDHVARSLHVSIDAASRQSTGDGMNVFLPSDVEVHRALPDLLRTCEQWLAGDNQRYRDRLRLRMAVVVGPVGPAANGFSGDTIVECSRLVESPPLRAALKERPDKDLVVLVSDHLYAFTVRQRRPGLPPEQFRKVRVSVKDYETEAWLWLGHNG